MIETSTANGNIVVEFEMLVDMDYGLVRLVRDYYRDDRLFFLSIADKNDNMLKGILKDRTMQNPLQVLFRDESKIELMDKLYVELLDKHYVEILDRSCETTIVTLVKKLIDSESGVSINIICHNRHQEDKIKKVFADCVPNSYCIDTIDILGGYDLNKYGSVFCKSYVYFPYYRNFVGKSIFLADQNSNFDQNILETKNVKIPEKDYAIFLESNEYRIIELYPYDNSYFPNRDYIIEEEDEDSEFISDEEDMDEEDDDETIDDLDYEDENNIY